MAKFARVMALVWIALLAAAPALAGESHRVVIENMQFQPADLVVRAGEQVVWVNDDLVPHTATAADGSFDSGSIEPGKSWTYTAPKAGAHAYACTFHPSMTGRITVR